MKILVPLFLIVLIFLGLNHRQLVAAFSAWSETNRLINQAAQGANEYQNPEALEDDFTEGLSPDFWRYTLINGGGQVSNANEWHASAMTFDHGLTIQHSPDPEFAGESSDPMQKPAAGQYNNVTIIGGSGFRPTPASDVVLQFTAHVSPDFYGSAGVIVQPQGTLGEDGLFLKPFDMFGLGIVGEESAVRGISGPLCYLALNWVPVRANGLNVDVFTAHDYEIRLRWVSKTGWQGILKVDDRVLCQMDLPAFGPLEVHVWSDNYLLPDKPCRWWEIAPAMELKYQDGGHKQFHLEKIRIFEKVR